MEEAPLLSQELKEILTNCRNEAKLIGTNDEQEISDQLLRLGVAFVAVDNDISRSIAISTGQNMNAAFGKLSEKVKTDLRDGYFSKFSAEWKKLNYKITEVAGKSNGMANCAPLDPDQRDDFSMSIDNNTIVHIPNQLNAINNVRMWEILELDPSRIFQSLLEGRIQVSEDGIKVIEKSRYEPTALHYDGQLGTRRIQIVYTADKGPVRLFVVPGSHLPRVQEIIQRITGVSAKTGFITMKDSFKKHPELSNILLQFGVALPSTGLLMFCANVWHFEGYEGPLKNELVRHVHTDDLRSKTSLSSVFRIYCGVVSVPNERICDLISFAHLREHGWCMDPYTTGNREEETFVNQKTTQHWAVTSKLSDEQKRDFKVLSETSLSEKKTFLSHLSSRRLGLYGLSPEDVSGPNDNNQSPKKRAKIGE